MCLAILSEKYFSIRFFNESILLSVTPDGELRSREIYDAFFVLPFDWAGARLLCVSPHNLLDAGTKLSVTPVGTPGAGIDSGEDGDLVYKKALSAKNAQWNEHSKQFSA